MSDGLGSGRCWVVFILMRLASLAAIAAFSLAAVIPERHLPLSRWCSCADGEWKYFLHFASAIHLMLLNGLCRPEFRCWFSAPRFLNGLSHSLHFVRWLPSYRFRFSSLFRLGFWSGYFLFFSFCSCFRCCFLVFPTRCARPC